MGIGQAGKRAKQEAKSHQVRYQISYGDSTHTPPLVGRVQRTADTTQLSANTDEPFIITDPDPAVIQRAIDDILRATEDAIRIEPDNNDSGTDLETNASASVDAEAVAELVYKMMLRDMKIERERSGKR